MIKLQVPKFDDVVPEEIKSLEKAIVSGMTRVAERILAANPVASGFSRASWRFFVDGNQLGRPVPVGPGGELTAHGRPPNAYSMPGLQTLGGIKTHYRLGKDISFELEVAWDVEDVDGFGGKIDAAFNAFDLDYTPV